MNSLKASLKTKSDLKISNQFKNISNCIVRNYIIALPIPVNFVTSSLYIITDNVLRYWASRPRNEHNNTSLFVLFLHTTRYLFEMYVVTYDCHFHCLKIQRIHETNLCSQQFIEVYMCVYVYVRVSL